MTGEVGRQLGEFLELWFGVQGVSSQSPAEAVAPLLTFNHPVAETFDGQVEVLVAEQQGVWLWGRTRSGRYVERENDVGVPWRELDEDEAEFWLHHAAFEAATNLAANRSAQLFDASTIANIRDHVTALPCGTWTWPGTHQSMFYRGECVVMICSDGDDFWVVASAPSEQNLDWLDALGLNWDEADTRRGAGP